MKHLLRCRTIRPDCRWQGQLRIQGSEGSRESSAIITASGKPAGTSMQFALVRCAPLNPGICSCVVEYVASPVRRGRMSFPLGVKPWIAYPAGFLQQNQEKNTDKCDKPILLPMN
jgi:hypothetical protein